MKKHPNQKHFIKLENKKSMAKTILLIFILFCTTYCKADSIQKNGINIIHRKKHTGNHHSGNDHHKGKALIQKNHGKEE